MTQEEENLKASVKSLSITVDSFSAFLGRNVKAQKENAATVTDSTRNLGHAVRNFDNALDDLGRSTGSLMSTMRNSSNSVIAVMGILGDRAIKLGDYWQKMTEVGQSFGGSMIDMIGKAGAAGLSLDDFVQTYQKHNVVIGATNGRFFDMQKQLRTATMAAGNYGMTVEQMTDFMADSLDISRKNGTLQSMSSGKVVKDMDDLAVTTSALANTSDKARSEIAKLANEALSSSLAIAAIRTAPVEIRNMMEKSAKEITLGFAAIPGEAGGFFSKFFADTLGANSALTAQGKTLIDAGIGNMASEMDGLARKVRAGGGSIEDEFAIQNRFIDTVDNNLESLKLQAAAGNDAASQVIQMASGMKKMTMAEFERQKQEKKNTETMTAFFASLESTFAILKGSFFEGFSKGFGRVFGDMSKFADSDTFKNFQNMLEKLGETFGTTISGFIKNLGPDGIIKLIKGGIDGLITFGNAVISIADVLGKLVADIAWTSKIITAPLNAMGVSAGKVGAALVEIVGTLWLFKKALGVISLGRALAGGGSALFGSGGAAAGAGAGAGGLGLLGRGAAGLMSGAGLFAAGSTLAGAAVGIGGNYLADKYTTKGSTTQKVSKIGSDAAGGALAGAGIGALFGGIGAAPGALIGGALGGAYGIYDNYISNSDSKNEEPTKDDPDPEADPVREPNTSEAAMREQTTSMGKMMDEMREQTDVMRTMLNVLNSRLDTANRLLSKIEVSAQSW